MRSLQQHADAAHYIADDMAEDVLERLAFLRHEPASALLVGDMTGAVAAALRRQGVAVTLADPAPMADEIALDEEQPYPVGGFDLIASLGTLDTVNDLPGALVHVRKALAPGGLAIVSIVGAGSAKALREIMLAADGERPAPRIHPMVDVRAGAQLMQRCGFADPVADSRALDVAFRSLSRMVGDLREQGLSACLERGGGAMSKAALARAEAAFTAAADAQGRVVETFEILTLSGWAKALRAPKF
ncbi:class I SAM-dependent methyltransferase [Novosphingobium cyanobacteriorum]|uniref:Class I SAM-dependent methyltransferase n=1 Tax=Novosphingobium cyanobacteriorum TaxID=3024215 RepID=A0ABT6CND9_9SPHN|nr:class I SAM-dependent methyltransferase [Novosphingobium cyanobacteriorum]MDF8335422.1 class I SAM-dependent methyltransferase [Novosphingobium cyanobacteriorum]